MVEAVIGAGGTAMVYRVRHGHLGTLHALKVLTITSDAIRKRMLNEGKVQATLRHLNLVAVTDVLDIGGNPGLLMEYIEGPSLERALGRYKIRMADAETLFHGIVSGVRQAHRFGVVHRDLKPANVLLDKSTAGFVPKVTDFGLVKTLSGAESMQHTRSGIAMGTPSYMAPEQIRDARTVDQRADVWSLGCILYELMTRRRAFPGDEALAIYNAVTVGDYPDPRKWEPELPDRIVTAIEGCLTVDREERIPDCDTLLSVVKGRKRWETLPRPTAEHAPDDPPRVLDTGVPDMPVADRGPGGATPGPPPKRQGRPPAVSGVPMADGAPADEETVFLEPGQQVDGTLDASDSLINTDMTGQQGLMVVAAGMGATMIGAGVFVVLGALFLGWIYFWPSTQVETEPEPMPVEGTPVEDVQPAPDTPDTPEPEPQPMPDPEPSPRPRPASPKPRPSPRPAPAPAAPATVVAKLLSSPPTASVWIDGVQADGRTPMKAELSPGTHTVRFESGDQRGEAQIKVTADGANKWCFDFATAQAKPGGC